MAKISSSFVSTTSFKAQDLSRITSYDYKLSCNHNLQVLKCGPHRQLRKTIIRVHKRAHDKDHCRPEERTRSPNTQQWMDRERMCLWPTTLFGQDLPDKIITDDCKENVFLRILNTYSSAWDIWQMFGIWAKGEIQEEKRLSYFLIKLLKTWPQNILCP